MVDHSARQLLLTGAPDRVGAMYGSLCMKFFGRNKDKVVQVRIVNPSPCFKSAPAELVPPPAAAPSITTLDYELGLKLAAITAVLLNSLLAMMGYVDFIGHLETLGISTNEIDLGLPTLLFQGYLSVVLGTLSSSANHLLVSLPALILIPIMFFYLPVSIFFKNREGALKIILCLMIFLGLMLVSMLPLLGLVNGEDSAYSTFESQNKTISKSTIGELTTQATIVTKEGPKIKGDTVFASTLYTYVLQGPELYKIANRDNHIVSVTKITAVLKSKPTPSEEPPKANAGS